MKQSRNNVFETNSSSTHSISIESPRLGDEVDNKFDMNCDGSVSMKFGEFGWEVREYTDAKTKFKYLCTMWFCLEGRGCTNVEELYKTEGFKFIEEGIISHLPQVKRLIIDEEGDDTIITKSYSDSNGKEITYLDINGHIDHQSVPDYVNKDTGKYENYSLKEWLKRESLTVEQFIFSKNVVLQISNDNM